MPCEQAASLTSRTYPSNRTILNHGAYDLGASLGQAQPTCLQHPNSTSRAALALRHGQVCISHLLKRLDKEYELTFTSTSFMNVTSF
jgi:hypothetical protein